MNDYVCVWHVRRVAVGAKTGERVQHREHVSGVRVRQLGCAGSVVHPHRALEGQKSIHVG